MNFNGILVGTDNVDRLKEYYTKIFGAPTYDDGGYATWQFGTGTMSIGPHSEVHGSSDQPGRIIWNIESDDVQGEFARMRDAGAIVVREPYDFEQAPGTWIATLADPDGNYFQLMSPFDPSSMGD